MARNLLQDMIRVKPSASGRERPVRNADSFTDADRDAYDTVKAGNGKSKYRIYFVAFIAILFLLFALSFLFSGARVTIVPKVQEIPLSNENLSAVKNGSASGLSFDLVVIPGEENKIIQGGEIKNVTVKATGTVIIYNSYSSSSQTLDIDTRLEGSNGKIYKTSKRITVPGMKGSTPGSVEVGIYGAVAGEEYNSAPIDFQILGFKGTPKYSKFYARSKSEITGGFSGKSPAVSALDKVTVVSELKATLEDKLLKKVTEQIPGGFILFKNAVFLDINDKDVSFTPDKDSTVSVGIKGALYGFLFDEKKLTKKIAEDIIDKYDGSEVFMPNIRDLVFSMPDKGNVAFADVKTVSFTLSGTPKIIWRVDEEKFVADILNKKKDEFNQILAQYPNIDSAELVVRPFWKSSFPETSKNIELIVNYPQ